MKLLFDQNLSYKLVKPMETVFPGSAHVRLLGLDQASDAEIWRYAQTNGFAIVTQDADFQDRVDLFGHPPKVIWLRCGNQPAEFVARLLHAHAQDILAFEQDLHAGCLEISR
jgi:predicted nuclease of predicted toxin-antitoxin system